MEKGTAEVFGCELLTSKPYTFAGAAKSCIFTHSGCSLSVTGTTLSEYVSEEVAVAMVLGLHYALEGHRIAAATKGASPHPSGPRVLVLGNGRTTLSRTLLNYAVRQGHAPMWVDLDLMNGSLVFPGVLGAMVLDHSVISVAEEIRATTDILTFFYSLTGPCVSGDPKALYGSTMENPHYLKAILERLGSNVCKRMEGDSKVNISGVIASGFPWLSSTSGICMDLLATAISAFKFSVLAVVGNEKLFSELDKKFSDSDVRVVKLRNSSGLVAKDPSFRRSLLNQRIYRYFNGGGMGVLPLEMGPFLSFPVIVPFKDLHIRRLGDSGPQAPTSALPIGTASGKQEEFRITRIELLPSAAVSMGISGMSTSSTVITTTTITPSSLLHSILALSSAPVDQEASIIDAPVVGFVLVSDVDETRGRLTLTAPAPGRLPKSFLLWSPSSSLKCVMLK